MSYKYIDLINLTDEQVIEKYDEHAQRTAVGISYYCDELNRRSNEKTNKIMIRCTIAITFMTAVMLISNIIILFK